MIDEHCLNDRPKQYYFRTKQRITGKITLQRRSHFPFNSNRNAPSFLPQEKGHKEIKIVLNHVSVQPRSVL